MFYTLLITYILGGLTFIPLLIFGVLAFAFYTSDLADSTPGGSARAAPFDEKSLASTTTTSQPSSATPRTPTLKAWLTVRRTFEPSPASYISLVRTLLDSRSSHPRRTEDTFYVVLKGPVLYLYEDEAMSECAAAIDVARCYVRVYPEHGLLDGELFAKRNALLVREKGSEGQDTSSTAAGADSPSQSPTPSSPLTPPWFMFFRSVTVMEDWYLALLAAPLITTSPPTLAPSSTPSSFAPYPYASHHALITSLDALPDLIPTRWLNALLGRLFLGVKDTRAVEAWVVGRLMKKLAKVKTPGFLSAVVVRSFDAGNVAPVLSKPMLKELTLEGEASVGVDLSYIAPPGGEMRITMSATVTISLPGTASLSLLGFNGGRGKDKDKERENDEEKEKHEEGAKSPKGEGKEKDTRPYEVSLVLAIVIRRVEGNVLLKIKRPPSNRLWYAFTTTPHMEVTVEPVVSDRRVRWGMVLTAIEGKLKEIIQESVVLPYMDDVPFFDTTPYGLRGGIFADAFSQAGRASDERATTATATSTTAPTASTAPDAAAGTTPSLATDRDSHTPQDALDITNNHAEASALKQQLHRTQSVDGVGDRMHAAGAGEAPSMVRAETLGATSGARKRRTWFGKREGSGDDGGGNGRRNPERRTSDESVKVVVTLDGDEQDESQRPHSARAISTLEDSSSAGSSTTVASAPVSASPMTSTSPTAPPLHPPSPGPSLSAPSPVSPSPVSPSFLSTLKTRSAGMAEKQPVLKEAIRKWGVGVNWAAGLRKDGGTMRDRERDRDREERERERGRERGGEREGGLDADHGEFWEGTHEGSGGDGSMRRSYADLRKKVEEREQERMRAVTGESSRGGGAGNGSRPIDIPGAELEGDVHVPSSFQGASSVRSDKSSSSIRKGSPQASGFLSPSAPRTTTELHTTVRTPSPSPIGAEFVSHGLPHPRTVSAPSAGFSLPMLEESTTPTQAGPIRAQPKAATMTIPGIHARHRGEVMALGSEPVKVEDGGAGTVTVTGPGEGAAAGKTIQSMYRLLRRGNVAQVGALGGVEDEEDRGPESSEKEVSLLGVAVPVPPPLPPRGVLATVGSGSEDSPASQALKSVVQQDAARQPPPLPTRRGSEQGLRLGDAASGSGSSSILSLSGSSGSPSSAFISVSPSSTSFTNVPTTSPANTPSVSSTPTPSSTGSDQEGPWLPLTGEPESMGGGLPRAPSRGTVQEGREKWKPPLPPRKNSSGSVGNVQV